MRDRVKVRGRVYWMLTNPDGSVVDVGQIDNVFTDFGLAQVAAMVIGGGSPGPQYIALGNGAGDPDQTDTGLFAEILGTRKLISSRFANFNTANFIVTYQTTDPSGAFTEAGLYDANVQTSTLSAQANPGDKRLHMAASAPAVLAGTEVFLPPIADPTVAPSLSNTPAGTSLGAGVYFVTYTFLSANGSETLPAPLSSITIAAGDKITVGAITLAVGASGVEYYVSVTPGSGTVAQIGSGSGGSFDITALPGGVVPPPDTNGTPSEYGVISSDQPFGAAVWPLNDSINGKYVVGTIVTAFTGNLWAHALVDFSKLPSQLLTVQWEVLLTD